LTAAFRLKVSSSVIRPAIPLSQCSKLVCSRAPFGFEELARILVTGSQVSKIKKKNTFQT